MSTNRSRSRTIRAPKKYDGDDGEHFWLPAGQQLANFAQAGARQSIGVGARVHPFELAGFAIVGVGSICSVGMMRFFVQVRATLATSMHGFAHLVIEKLMHSPPCSLAH